MLTGWKKEEAHRDVNAARNILPPGWRLSLWSDRKTKLSNEKGAGAMKQELFRSDSGNPRWLRPGGGQTANKLPKQMLNSLV